MPKSISSQKTNKAAQEITLSSHSLQMASMNIMIVTIFPLPIIVYASKLILRDNNPPGLYTCKPLLGHKLVLNVDSLVNKSEVANSLFSQ